MRVRLSLLELLAEAGIPDAVSTFRLTDNPQLIFVAASSHVLSRLYWYGQRGWEPELLPWWRHACRRSNVILELGANIGYFSVLGARAAPSARYTAVEPHPFSARVCQANLELNGVRSVRVLAAAAVPGSGVPSVELLVPSDQLATPTVAFIPVDTELPGEMACDVTTVYRVPAVDVRSLLDGVDLVKLDVEGQEHALLAAARPCLRARQPTIFVEVLPGTTRLRTLLGTLCDEDGYRCYAAMGDLLVPLDPSHLTTVQLKKEYGSQDLILSADDLPRSTAELGPLGYPPALIANGTGKAPATRQRRERGQERQPATADDHDCRHHWHPQHPRRFTELGSRIRYYGGRFL